jgi:hypothetical protein
VCGIQPFNPGEVSDRQLYPSKGVTPCPEGVTPCPEGVTPCSEGVTPCPEGATPSTQPHDGPDKSTIFPRTSGPF